MRTEASFCPILKIKLALESWDSILSKNIKFFSCVHFARRLAKIWGVAILAILRAKCTQEFFFNIFGKYGVSAF